MTTAYLNGAFLPYDAARLPLHDAGFVMGATVTDLVRTFHQKLYRLDDHLRRFRQSCGLCRVPLLESDARLREIARELVHRNAGLIQPNDDLALVMFATPGPLGFYGGLPGGAGDGSPTLGMHTFPLPFDRYHRLFTHGARLVIPQTRAQSAVDPRAKQRSRMHWWIASQQAHDMDPLADALFLEADGFVTETASANLLVVKNGDVTTPPFDSVLPGVSLQVVRELCDSLGIVFREQKLTPNDCFAADELMLTCTTWCLAGVSALAGRPVPWPGGVFQKLSVEWAKTVNQDFVKQIVNN